MELTTTLHSRRQLSTRSFDVLGANEQIELLQKLWLDGWSASRIASELAHGITRNAVIGKVYRLGLSGRAKAAIAHVPAAPLHQKSPRRAAHSRPSAAPPSIGNTALALQPMVIEAARPQAVEDVVVPISEPVTIMELRESIYRAPIGDPTQSEFRFCGAEIAGPRTLLRLSCGHRLSWPA